MPWCVTVGCSNNTFSKNCEKGVSFYSFPKDMKKRWLANIKREKINKNPILCHHHFKKSCSKRDLEVSLWYFYVNLSFIKGYIIKITCNNLLF